MSLLCFQPFVNSPQNSEYFEYSHIRSKKKSSPCRMLKTKSPAPLAPTKSIDLYNHFGIHRAPPPPPPRPWAALPRGQFRVPPPHKHTTNTTKRESAQPNHCDLFDFCSRTDGSQPSMERHAAACGLAMPLTCCCHTLAQRCHCYA